MIVSTALHMPILMSMTASRREDVPWIEVVIWMAVMLGFIIAGIVFVVLMKRRLGLTDNREQSIFTLHELRQLRSRGEISEDEYEKAKSAIVGLARQGTAVADSPTSADHTGVTKARTSEAPPFHFTVEPIDDESDKRTDGKSGDTADDGEGHPKE